MEFCQSLTAYGTFENSFHAFLTAKSSVEHAPYSVYTRFGASFAFWKCFFKAFVRAEYPVAGFQVT